MRPIDLSNVTTYPLAERHNLVHLNNLHTTDAQPPSFESSELDAVIDRIIEARHGDHPVIWMMGGHVIKSGLSCLLIDLMRRGIVTHVAGNGAVSIHDFELALIGETSEDVASSLEDGTFGMADETGRWMNQAIQEGARDGLGYGAAIGRYIAERPEQFPHRDVNVLYNAYVLGIPATIHATIGTDIIHQHPTADFGALGAAAGTDFRLFAGSVSQLDNGVFLNFGSAVTGPEVFLKALTIVRNLGHLVARITTANFDLIPLGEDYHSPAGYDNPVYYYRPRKNIINRPTSLGGQGYHITGDHTVTIPNLYHRVVSALDNINRPAPKDSPADHGPVQAVLDDLTTRQPELTAVVPDLLRAFQELVRCFKSGGTLYLCGNGGSMADALHISGELLKSFNQRRPLPDRLQARLSQQPDGDRLVLNLEPGLRVVVLGANLSLSSAIANDMPDRDVNLAQELLALTRPGDVLWGISTSGNARNVYYAAQVARALNLPVIALTGENGGHLAGSADIVVRAPAQRTDRIQELHVMCYHALCEMLEVRFFGKGATRS